MYTHASWAAQFYFPAEAGRARYLVQIKLVFNTPLAYSVCRIDFLSGNQLEERNGKLPDTFLSFSRSISDLAMNNI